MMENISAATTNCANSMTKKIDFSKWFIINCVQCSINKRIPWIGPHIIPQNCHYHSSEVRDTIAANILDKGKPENHTCHIPPSTKHLLLVKITVPFDLILVLSIDLFCFISKINCLGAVPSNVMKRKLIIFYVLITWTLSRTVEQ